MRILSRYISEEFIKIFLLTMAALFSVYLVVDFFEKTDIFIAHKTNLLVPIKYFIFKLPLIVLHITPIAVLISTILTLGLFSKNNELTAIKANGISIYKVITPLLLISVLISIFVFINNEFIVPYTNKKTRYIMDVEIKGKLPRDLFKQSRIWFHGEDKIIFNIQLLNPNENSMKGVTLYKFGKNYQLKERITAAEAVWKDSEWYLKDVITRRFKDNNVIKTTKFEEKIINIKETPFDFKKVEKNPEELSFNELREYVQKLKNQGYNATPYIVDLYSKTSLPFIAFIMVIIGAPFAVKSSRNSGWIFGIGISLIIGFSYWILLSIGLSLGHAGKLFPFVATWGGNILFGLIGTYMLISIRQ